MAIFQCYEKIAKVSSRLEKQGVGRKYVLSIFIRSKAFHAVYVQFPQLLLFFISLSFALILTEGQLCLWKCPLHQELYISSDDNVPMLSNK